MNSKSTIRWLPLILVIALVLTFGLLMAYAPTAATTADAEITIPGEYMYDSGNTYFAYGEDKFSSDYNFWVQDLTSGQQYKFDRFPYEFFNMDDDDSDGYPDGNVSFCYPIETPAASFISGASPLWSVMVYENDLSTAKWVTLTARYATYDYWGRPVEYLDADPTEPGLYAVVLSIDETPYCSVLVDLYERKWGHNDEINSDLECPVSLRQGSFTYGDVKMHDILSACFDTSGNAIAQLDPLYSNLMSVNINDSEDTPLDSYNGSSYSQEDAYIDAGEYMLKVFYYDATNDYSVTFDITINKAPLSHDINYGKLDAQAEYMYVDLGTNPSGVPFAEANVSLQWMYDDNGTPAVLPTGRYLIPGTYQVWATLTGADAANFELVSVTYNNEYAISEDEPATLTVHNKDIGTLELTTADFAVNSYSDRDTYDFLVYADTQVNDMATSKGAYCEAYWYYLDDETPVKFDEFADAANYELYFCLYGEDAEYFNFVFEVDGSVWDSKNSTQSVTVSPYVLSDVSICYGSEMGMPLNMYKEGDAEANNNLYCAPTGFVLTARSGSKTEVDITIEGWKEDLEDDEEEVTTDITNVLGTWYAVGINAPDSNYTVDPTIRCKVTVNQRVFEIIGSASASYTGEEVKPFYNVMSSQFNPGEAISWDDDNVKKLLFTDGLNNQVLGTSVGSGYHYGVEVKDNTRYVIFYGGSNHISIDWDYEVTQSLPTISFSTDGKEAFWHKQSLTTADDLAKKLEWIITTNDPELFPDDQVELDTDFGTGGFKYAMYDYPSTWYNGLPTAMNKGDTFRIQIKTTESSSGNYLAWEGTTDWFTVEEAPVYIVWENQHDFTYNDVSQGPDLGEFNYYLYHPGIAEGGILAVTQDSTIFDEYGYWSPNNEDGNNSSAVWSATQSIEGTTSELWAGTYTMTFELKDSSTLPGIENYVLVGDTVTWKILQKEIEISQFSIPGTFTYGGYAGGSSYYDLPTISYVEASDGDEYGDMVIGTASGFGATLPNQYRIAFETWEFALRTDKNVAAADYTGAWTVWDTSDAENLVVPKDAGTYYVRYSAFFCQVTSWNETYWTASEWNADHKTYYVDYQYAIIVINPMAIELNWIGLENTYDANSHAATISATLCYNDVLADCISFTDTAYTDYQEGGYTLTATVADNANGTKNYVITNPTATLNINKACLTVNLSSYNIYYGDARPAYGYTLSGFLEAAGETQADKEANLKWLGRLSGAPTISCEYSQYDDIGDYEITVSVGTLSALNYEFDVNAVAGVNVAPKAIIVTINDRSSTYGDAFAGFSSSDNGIVNNDQGVYSLSIHTVADGVKGDAFSIGTTTAVGTYYIFGTAVDPNYSITFSAAHDVIVGEDEVAVAEYEVLNATITGTLEQSGTLTYNGGDQTASVSNTLASVNKQDITVTYGTSLGVYDSAAVPQFKNVAGTKIVYWQAEAANHTTKTGYFTVTIAPKEVTVAFDPADLKKTYDGTAIKPDGVGAISGATEGEALTVVFDGANRYKASKYTATFTLAANNAQTVVTNYTLVAVGTPDPYVVDGDYSVSAETGSVTVQVLQRTIEFAQLIDGENATSVTYNGAAKVFSLSFTNKVAGDDVYLYLSTTQGGAGAATQTETVKAAYTYYVIFGGDEDLLSSYNLPDGADAQVTFTIASKIINVTYALVNYGEFTYGDTTGFNNLYGINNKANFYGMLTLSEALNGGEAVADVIDLSFKKGGVITPIGATADVGKYVLYATIKEGVTNYAFNFQVNSDEKAYINITKKALTATWNVAANGVLHEDNSDKWFEFVYNGQAQQAYAELEGVEGDDTVTITYGQYSTWTDVTPSSFHVASISGLSGADAGNYSINTYAASSSHNFKIIPKPITVNWGTTAFTYTGEGLAPTVGITGGSIVAGDAADISLVEPTKQVNANAVNANYTATVSLSGNKAANYTITNNTCDFTIAPYAVTPALYIDDELVDGDNGSVTYDGNNHVFVIKATGLNEDEVIFHTSVNDEHINVFNTGAGYNAGYRGHATGVFDNNYAVKENCYFNWAITARLLSLNWELEANGDYSGEQFPGYKTFTDFTYNGKVQHPVADLQNVVDGEDVEIVYPAGIKNAITNGGYHAYEIVSFKGNDKNNYAWANDAEKKVYFDLKAKPITVTIDPKESVYGEARVGLTATTEENAIEEGDALPYTLACTVSTETGVGSYAITGSGINSNYAITFVGEANAYTVTKAQLSATVTVANVTYGTAVKAPVVGDGITVTGWKGNADSNELIEEVYVLYFAKEGEFYEQFAEIMEGVNEMDEEAVEEFLETYSVVPTAAGDYYVFVGIADLDNYFGVDEAHSEFTIAKKAITVTFVDDSTTYGEEFDFEGNVVSYDGFVYEEDETVLGGELDFDTEYTAASVVADYDVTPKGLTSDNYAITFVKGTLSVDKADLDLNINVKDVSYGTAFTLEKTIEGWVNGDTAELLKGEGVLTIGYAPIKYADEDEEELADIEDLEVMTGIPTQAGEYIAFVIIDNLDNYNSQAMEVSFIIGKAALIISAEDKTVVYGSETPAFTVKYTGLQYNEDEKVLGGELTFACERTLTSAVGEYRIVPSGLSSNNYAIFFTNAKLFVTKKAITVTADAKESFYKDDLAELTFSDDGIVGDDEVVTIATDADKTKTGEYAITLTSTENPNYDVTLVNGKYTVKAKAVVNESGEVEKTEDIKEEIKQAATAENNEGVSIKNMIQNVIEAAADAPVATLEIEVTDAATVAFDKAALQKLAENADVKITYKETQAADVDQSNKDLKSAQLVIEISLNGATFEGGKATITTKFENKASGGKKAVVYYVDENGKKTDMNATFENGEVTFETTHFSTYVVEYVLTGGSIAGIVIACVVGAAGIAVGVFFFLKKKKGANGGNGGEAATEAPAEAPADAE